MGVEAMILQIDSRESNNKKIKDYFDSIGQEYFISKLPCGDYANPQNMKVVIELKHSHNDGLGELVMNLCRTITHQRFKNEVMLSKKNLIDWNKSGQIRVSCFRILNFFFDYGIRNSFFSFLSIFIDYNNADFYIAV